MRIKKLRSNRILVLQCKEEQAQTTAGGIILLDKAIPNNNLRKGFIVQRGEGISEEEYPGLQVKQPVYFARGAGTPIMLQEYASGNENEYLILKTEEIIATE